MEGSLLSRANFSSYKHFDSASRFSPVKTWQLEHASALLDNQSMRYAEGAG